MTGQYTSISFGATLDEITFVNSSFDQATLRIGYHGDNHKGSSISKESFESAIPSMFNCPVVCRYIREDDNLGGHDVEIIKGESGFKLINLTQPVGVVPESAQWFWREVTEDDGKAHEYLCTQVLLWKRQEAYSYIKQNGIVGQSMEINIRHSYKRSDGYKVYDAFEFTAFCLLGEGVTPCFESASLEIFDRGDMHDQMSEMMEDFRREFSMVNPASADDTNNQTTPKGGSNEMNLDELMKKYGLSQEDVNFDTDDMSDQDIEARFVEIKSAKDAPHVQNECAQPEPDDPSSGTFSMTANQVFDSLLESLSEVTYIDTRLGEACELYRYFAMDFDLETSEVYVWDDQEGKVYGFPFTMNGDLAVIDFACKKRKKAVYVDYDEGSSAFPCENPLVKMKDPMIEAYSKLEGEIIELRTFKDNTVKADAASKRKEAVGAVFAKFEYLFGNEMFEALREGCEEMTIEEIEDKCYSIKGRVSDGVTFSMNPQTPPAVRIPTDAYTDKLSKHDDEPYGGVFAKFGIGQR